jgi:L-fuconolactonase
MRKDAPRSFRSGAKRCATLHVIPTFSARLMAWEQPIGVSDSTSAPRPTGYLELASAWKPYVETGIEAFGVDRCMKESDFPADGRSCGFVPLWNALKYIVSSCSTEEKVALLHRTAARVYRIELPAGPN